MKKLIGIILILSTARASGQGDEQLIMGNPDSALFVHTDINHFWDAFDKINTHGKDVFDVYYIKKGSTGVRHFLDHNRIVNGDSLLNTVQRRKSDYLKIREKTMHLAEIIPQCRATYYAFNYLYPQAKFPPLYFVIGRFNTGGVSLKTEQIIGAEMNEPDNIPFLVAHELIHANQNIPYKYKILLEQCIIEGSADFLGEMISGRVASAEPYRYAAGKEEALWNEFLKDLHFGENDDFSNWLYAGNRRDERPADMGYYIGYAITKAYYDKATDKKKAIAEILHISDCKEFLRKSGYRPSH